MAPIGRCSKFLTRENLPRWDYPTMKVNVSVLGERSICLHLLILSKYSPFFILIPS
ncbi:MAG: hypothetical protein ACTSRZ_04620 [Promethearchaeota archaeon]